MERRRASGAMYDQLARIGKALASPVRLRLLDLLRQGPRPVEALAEQIGESVPNTSQHLQILKKARLVDGDRNGQQVVYRVAGDPVSAFFSQLCEVGQLRLAEMDRLREQMSQGAEAPDDLTQEEVLERMRRGRVTLLDVRPRVEFEAGHVAGALSIPMGELSRRLGELPADREVVVYCRGPFCYLAADAVVLLRRAGLRVRRLDLGVTELRSRRFRIETGATGPPIRARRTAAPSRETSRRTR